MPAPWGTQDFNYQEAVHNSGCFEKHAWNILWQASFVSSSFLPFLRNSTSRKLIWEGSFFKAVLGELNIHDWRLHFKLDNILYFHNSATEYIQTHSQNIKKACTMNQYVHTGTHLIHFCYSLSLIYRKQHGITVILIWTFNSSPKLLLIQ